jgi:hypothetical protein
MPIISAPFNWSTEQMATIDTEKIELTTPQLTTDGKRVFRTPTIKSLERTGTHIPITAEQFARYVGLGIHAVTFTVLGDRMMILLAEDACEREEELVGKFNVVWME